MRTLHALLVILVACSAATAQAPDTAPIEAQLEAYVDGVVTGHMRQHGTPGVTVSIVLDRRLLFAKGYGVADLEAGRAVTGDDTLFRIGSLSKTFIWTAVMMLVERGQLDLDTDVNQYLQGMTIPATFEAPVTLNDLLAHRAGFEASMAVFMHSDDTELTVTEALLRDMPERVNPPAVRTSYSNWGSTLVSKIVADVSGTSYEQFLEGEIFAPLAMTKTTLKGPSLLSPQLARKMSVGYKTEQGRPVPDEYMQIGPHAPAGAIASTAANMARWMLVHLGGGQLDDVRLMSEQTHELMWTRAFTDRPGGADLAHGFMAKPHFGYETFGHGGATQAFYTNMVLVPDLGLGVFVSQNASGDRALVTELPTLVIERLAEPGRGPGDTTPVEAIAERAAECAGSYMGNRRPFTRFEKLFAAGDTTTVTATDDGSLVVSGQGPATRYEPCADLTDTPLTDTYQDRFGNRIVFGRDEGGAVTHFHGPWGVHSYDRIGPVDAPNTAALAAALVVLFSVTTWFGIFWRHGVPEEHTTMSRLLGVAAALAAVAVFVFAGVAAWVVIGLSAMTAADLAEYPPTPLTIFRPAALVMFAIGIAALVTIWPAWRSSGWRLPRKLHHTLFAMSLVTLAFMLFRWNVVFAPMAV